MHDHALQWMHFIFNLHTKKKKIVFSMLIIIISTDSEEYTVKVSTKQSTKLCQKQKTIFRSNYLEFLSFFLVSVFHSLFLHALGLRMSPRILSSFFPSFHNLPSNISRNWRTGWGVSYGSLLDAKCAHSPIFLIFWLVPFSYCPNLLYAHEIHIEL